MNILTEGLSIDSQIDLSAADIDYSAYSFRSEDVCLIGVPSLGGRAPSVVLERLKQMRANGAKEIGILRSVGARKKDISVVFIMESLLIGLVAGVLGVGLAYVLTIPVNWLIASIVGISSVANLTAIYAVILV